MVLKTPKIRTSQKGLTYVELTVSIAIVVLLSASLLFALNPAAVKRRGRDEKRLSDIQTLDRYINEYRIDNGAYPDLTDTTRTSNVVPSGSAGPLENVAGNGWITADFSDYGVKLPFDPINDSTYKFSYRHTDSGYELNIALEYYTDHALNSNDGGNSDVLYEIGNDLTIL